MQEMMMEVDGLIYDSDMENLPQNPSNNDMVLNPVEKPIEDPFILNMLEMRKKSNPWGSNQFVVLPTEEKQVESVEETKDENILATTEDQVDEEEVLALEEDDEEDFDPFDGISEFEDGTKTENEKDEDDFLAGIDLTIELPDLPELPSDFDQYDLELKSFDVAAKEAAQDEADDDAIPEVNFEFDIEIELDEDDLPLAQQMPTEKTNKNEKKETKPEKKDKSPIKSNEPIVRSKYFMNKTPKVKQLEVKPQSKTPIAKVQPEVKTPIVKAPVTEVVLKRTSWPKKLEKTKEGDFKTLLERSFLKQQFIDDWFKPNSIQQYQLEGIKWFINKEGGWNLTKAKAKEGGILGDLMGMGKTVQFIAASMSLMRLEVEAGLKHEPTLIVVPKPNLCKNWVKVRHI
jgi:SNF2 family DNA or RNA helicase